MSFYIFMQAFSKHSFAAGFGCLVLYAVLSCAEWKIFEKAGEEGWKAIVPVYGSYVFYKITMGTGWYVLLAFIPVVGSIVHAVAEYKLCRGFGRGVLFFIGLLFMPYLFELYLGFGSDSYVYCDTF